MGAGACKSSACCSDNKRTPLFGREFERMATGGAVRPKVLFSELHDLDLVLIRSAVGVGAKASSGAAGAANGVLDARISSSIKFYNANYYMPPSNLFEKWDRIGFLQLPSAAIQPHNYSVDNLEVTEATETGVLTRTLRQVFEAGAAEIAIRVLILDGDTSDETRANSAAMNTTSMLLAAAGADVLNAAASEVASGLKTNAAIAEQKKKREAELTRRSEGVMMRFYEFVPPLIQTPYAQCMEAGGLKPMFFFIKQQLNSFALSDSQVDAMNRILDRYDRDRTGSIAFDDLVAVFKELAAHNQNDPSHPMNTLNSSEIFQLASSFASSHSNKITRNDFMSAWRSSIERTTRSRKEPRTRAIVSGAFASLCLQKIGLLDENAAAYYLPMNFAERDVTAAPTATAAATTPALAGGYDSTQPVPVALKEKARLGPELVVPIPPLLADDVKA